MRVLIVDDDIPTVDVIRDSIRWESLQITNVDTAFDLRSAKERIVNAVPDIVLCDIEMPDGTGIDLMRWIKERDLACRIIFITCHMSFEYASAAIAGHAFGYITKPFDQKETETVIAKAVNDIVRQDELLAYSHYGQQYLKAKVTLEEQFWRKLIFQELGDSQDMMWEAIRTEYSGIDVAQSVRPVLVTIPASIVAKQWNDDIFRIAFRNLVSAIVLETMKNVQIIAYTRHNSFYCFFPADLALPVSNIQRCCNQIILKCKEKLDLVASCYIGDVTPLEKLPEARRFLQAYDKNNVAHKGTTHWNLHRAEDMNAGYSLDTLELKKLFAKSKPHEVIDLMGNTLSHLFSQNRLSSTVLQAIRQDYHQALYAYLAEHSIAAHELFMDTVDLEQTAEASMIDFMKWVTLTVSRAVAAVNDNYKNSQVTAKIKSFIHSHYRQNISLEDVARIVYLSPDYASKLFKTDTGISVKDYLNQYRIEKAKQILKHNGASVSKAALEVGFENFPYFSTLFKQMTGCSPSSYRSRVQGESESGGQ